MIFDNEQRQAEWETFQAYYAAVSKRPFTASTRSVINQLDGIAKGQFGNAAFQELRRDNRREAPASPTMGKESGGGSSRRSQSPSPSKPLPGSARAERLRKLEEQKSRSETDVPVVEDSEPIERALANVAEQVAKAGATAEQLQWVNPPILSDADAIAADAAELSAVALAEKYGREALLSFLISKGVSPESLEEKTDRQLANMVKKSDVA